MSYEIDTATGYIDLLNRIDTFLHTNGKAFDPVFTGAGNGTISAWDGKPNSVAETWTITATSPTNFTVTGSVSGAKAAATVGTAYDNGLVKFTLTAGSTAFVAGDQFKLNTCPKWDRQYIGATDITSNPRMLITKAPGNDGQKAIYIGLTAAFNTANDIYSIQASGLTGYAASVQRIQSQPGSIGSTDRTMPTLPLWDSTIPYWMCANGNMLRVVAKVSTVYVHLYVGFLKHYLPTTDYPYPIFTGGSVSNGYNRRWSDTSDASSAYWRGVQIYDRSVFDNATGLLRLPDGSLRGMYGWGSPSDSVNRWCGVYPFNAYDYNNRGSMGINPAIDGSYVLWPIVVFADQSATGGAYQTTNIFGEFDGVFAVSGRGNSAENTTRVGQVDHVVFPNVFRTERDQYCAFALN